MSSPLNTLIDLVSFKFFLSLASCSSNTLVEAYIEEGGILLRGGEGKGWVDEFPEDLASFYDIFKPLPLPPRWARGEERFRGIVGGRRVFYDALGRAPRLLFLEVVGAAAASTTAYARRSICAFRCDGVGFARRFMTVLTVANHAYKTL